jgi:hypothetical protein
MNTQPLLDFIGKYESNGDYNIVWGGIKSADKPPKLLTTMTVGEVLDWQDSIDAKYNSEASGKYQIMEDTLRELVSQGHAQKTEKFDINAQDRLATALLKRRGLDSYLSGKITAEKFANFVAREWASMPLVDGPNKGKSYYEGDGLNTSHTPVAAYLAAIKSVRLSDDTPFVRPDAPNNPTSAPAATVGALAAIWAAVVAFFALRK